MNTRLVTATSFCKTIRHWRIMQSIPNNDCLHIISSDDTVIFPSLDSFPTRIEQIKTLDCHFEFQSPPRLRLDAHHTKRHLSKHNSATRYRFAIRRRIPFYPIWGHLALPTAQTAGANDRSLRRVTRHSRIKSTAQDGCPVELSSGIRYQRRWIKLGWLILKSDKSWSFHDLRLEQ